MRKLIFAINLTLDGCCDHTKGIADEELHDFYAQLLRDGDTFVYGRKTYDLMVPFWPDIAKTNAGPTKSMNNFAQAFNAVKKIVVFSRSLENVDDKKTTIVRTNLKDEILKLKKQEGKNILTGGVDIPSQLIGLGLVDEYYFVFQPLVVGAGRRLFDHAALQEKLQLVETKVFTSGCVALRYVKGGAA
ncbi:dihydrofolate reductase family protein [Chryseolinea sp. H1M3-3]|uniref:dihydrofolate reductase family protein n=1 Tax=Chryseolinea sp. H1M3-3 TaxID=3034144 RepID=UPI0023ECA8F4|nr:dihydrofolate reductase family protein [Chryseolinea sp. H1M3-3]